MSRRSPLPAYVLAGGRSSRFGQDKALLVIDGRPQLLRLMSALQDAARSPRDVHVVADRPDRYQSLGITSLVDAAPGAGPVAGLATALDHRRRTYGTGWLLLCPCDQVVWKSQWEEQLRSGTVADTVAVLFRPVARQLSSRTQAGGPAQTTNRDAFDPLPGLYHTDLYATLSSNLEQALRGGLRALLRDLPTALVPTADPPSRYSVNTPADLQSVRTALASPQQRHSQRD